MTRRLLVVLAVAGCGGKKSGPAIDATAAFVDVTVVDVEASRATPHQTVLVRNDEIVAIGPVDGTPVADGATRIDGAGKWLIPGLIDMHVHFNDPRDALLYVANGVTTVRNMWGNPQTLDLRERAKKNDPTWLGPRIYTAGPIVDGTPPIWPGSDVVDTPEQAAAEVETQKKAGYDFIKVYDNLPLAAYDALAAAAAKQGMRFAGHVPSAVPLAHALESHQASIEHVTGYLLAAQDATSTAASKHGIEQRVEIAQHIDASKFPALAAATKQAGVANCPTLVVQARFGELEHPEALAARPENKYVPPATRASWDPKQDFRLKAMSPAAFATMRKSTDAKIKLVKALAGAGATIVAGTDTPNPFVVPGFSLHEELERLVAAGLTPAQALRAATFEGAHWLVGIPELGRIKVGTHADLVLLDADPLADIKATTKRSGVMLRGTWFTQKALDDKLEAQAKSYGEPKDRFAGAPALEVDASAELLYRASYRMSFGGAEVGVERLAITRAKDGARTFTAQFAGDQGPKLVTMKLVLDKAGELASLVVDEDDKHGELTRHGDTLHVVSSGRGPAKTADEPFAHDLLLDTNLIAAMIPFAERGMRGKPGDKVAVAGKAVVFRPAVALEDLSYTFERDATKVVKFTVGSGRGTQPGTYEVDDRGYPVALGVKVGPTEITVRRD